MNTIRKPDVADLRAAALAVEIAAQRPETPEWLKRHLRRAVTTLDACMEERRHVPRHWLPQHAEPAAMHGNVVRLRRDAC